MTRTTIRASFPVQRRPQRNEERELEHSQSPPPKGSSRAARMLALAHYVECLVEAGELTGYAEAARELGLTRARMTQVMNLALLTPRIQEQVLLGGQQWTERALRRVAREAEWCIQGSMIQPTICTRIEPLRKCSINHEGERENG